MTCPDPDASTETMSSPVCSNRVLLLSRLLFLVTSTSPGRILAARWTGSWCRSPTMKLNFRVVVLDVFQLLTVRAFWMRESSTKLSAKSAPSLNPRSE